MPGKKKTSSINADPLHLRSIRLALNTAYRLSPRMAGKWCYRVLAKPPRAELSPSEKSCLAAAEQGILPVGIMKIRTYRWPGAGPRVLLAHGWNSHTGRWQPLIKKLVKAGYDVYALDAPAHGASYGGHFAVIYYADVVAAAVAKVAPYAIVGHSAGGMASLYYLQHELEAFRPEKLALLAVPAELTEFMASFQRVIGMRPEVMEALETEFSRRFDKDFSYFSNAEYVKDLQIPGLIVHDQTDDIAPVSGATRMKENWEESELLLTNGLGHSVLGEVVEKRVLEWLEEG
jgi:pimeloyl-ACP methyl ester carboxylesterase